jgi:myo-inositol-1(or 4)-monophosphatase
VRDALADRDLIAEAASRAGEIALAHFGRGIAAVEKPGGAGPVTEADKAVDTFLRETLGAARPDYGWLSEETEDSPARLASSRLFIVDPIDGTRAFISGEKGWAVSIAVIEDRRPVVACVLLPARGEMYLAATGEGATLQGRAVTGSGRARIEGAGLLAVRSQLQPEHWPGGVPPVERAFRPSLAWRLCLAASGRFDAMLTLRDSWEWDIAAGVLIAAEAGLTVTDRAGEMLAFNAPDPRLPGVIAAPPPVHAALLERRRAGPRD